VRGEGNLAIIELITIYVASSDGINWCLLVLLSNFIIITNNKKMKTKE